MEILRRDVIPVASAFLLVLGMILYAWRHPEPEPIRRPPPWSKLLRHLGLTIIGGYLCFLAIVLVFHVLIAGQHGALRSAAFGGGFLAFGVATPAFVILAWLEARRSR